MSNYKWVKISANYVELRKEDFSSVPSFEVNNLDPILMKKMMLIIGLRVMAF